jgi:hypothetical protein
MASAAPRYLLVEAHGDWLQGETSPEAQHNRVIYIIGLSRHSRGWLVLSATRGMPRIDNPPEVASRYLELQLHAEPHAHRSSPSVRVDGLTDHYTGKRCSPKMTLAPHISAIRRTAENMKGPKIHLSGMNVRTLPLMQ